MRATRHCFLMACCLTCTQIGIMCHPLLHECSRARAVLPHSTRARSVQVRAKMRPQLHSGLATRVPLFHCDVTASASSRSHKCSVVGRLMRPLAGCTSSMMCDKSECGVSVSATCRCCVHVWCAIYVEVNDAKDLACLRVFVVRQRNHSPMMLTRLCV